MKWPFSRSEIPSEGQCLKRRKIHLPFEMKLSLNSLHMTPYPKWSIWHTHTWGHMFSICIWGMFMEQTPDGVKWIFPGRFRYRRGPVPHRVCGRLGLTIVLTTRRKFIAHREDMIKDPKDAMYTGLVNAPIPPHLLEKSA